MYWEMRYSCKSICEWPAGVRLPGAHDAKQISTLFISTQVSIFKYLFLFSQVSIYIHISTLFLSLQLGFYIQIFSLQVSIFKCLHYFSFIRVRKVSIIKYPHELFLSLQVSICQDLYCLSLYRFLYSEIYIVYIFLWVSIFTDLHFFPLFQGFYTQRSTFFLSFYRFKDLHYTSLYTSRQVFSVTCTQQIEMAKDTATKMHIMFMNIVYTSI